MGKRNGKQPGCVYGFCLAVRTMQVTGDVFSKVVTLYIGLSCNTSLSLHQEYTEPGQMYRVGSVILFLVSQHFPQGCVFLWLAFPWLPALSL